jgi:hypothetical protein
VTETDPIERVRILVSAASRTTDLALRALYVAEARSYLEAEGARLKGAADLVEAQETELARLARGAA